MKKLHNGKMMAINMSITFLTTSFFIIAFNFGITILQNTQISQFDPKYVITLLGKPTFADVFAFLVTGFIGFVCIVNSVLLYRQIDKNYKQFVTITSNDTIVEEAVVLSKDIKSMHRKILLYSTALFFLSLFVYILLFSTL